MNLYVFVTDPLCTYQISLESPRIFQ